MNNLSQDCVTHLSEEATHTDAYTLAIPGVEQALNALRDEFSPSFVDQSFLARSKEKSLSRVASREALHANTVRFIFVSGEPISVEHCFKGPLGS